MTPASQKRSAVHAQKLLKRLSPHQQNLFETATVLAKQRGLSVYLVGGSVRDLVIGSATTDLDLAVTGDALAYAKTLATRLGARVTVHPKFGTATLVFQDGLRLDIATTRREVYAHPAALPDVSPGTIREDLFRRDFTINAMAVRLSHNGGEILDPYGGLNDLKRGLLQTLHEGSYRDDPTRILRGARYAARYRLRFSRQDRRLIRDVLAEKVLKRLSRDRLFQEVKLLLSEPSPEDALKLLENLGVLRALDPALDLGPNTGSQMRHVRRAWERYHNLISPEPRLWRIHLLVLLLSVHPTVRDRVGQHLGIKPPHISALVSELKQHPELQKKLDQRQLRATRLRQLLDRASGDLRVLVWATGGRRVRERVDRYLTQLASIRPALTGQDLQRLGFPPGPGYRRILNLLLARRLEGRLRSREEEINFLRQRFSR